MTPTGLTRDAAAPPMWPYTNAGSSASIGAMYDDMVAVIENRALTGGHFLLSLDAPRQAAAVRPGQFAMVRILGRTDVLLRRPMSVFNVTAKEERDGGLRPARAPRVVELLYKVVGRGTRLMAELKPGDRVGLLAPLGHGFFEEEYLPRAHEADEILHVAGGIGVAALLLPAKHLAEAGFKQRLFFGARTKDDLVGAQEFKPLVRATLFAAEDGSAGYRGFVTRPLEEYLAKHTNQKLLLMVCGPGRCCAPRSSWPSASAIPAWSRWRIAWVAGWVCAWAAAFASRAKATKLISASARKGRCFGRRRWFGRRGKNSGFGIRG